MVVPTPVGVFLENNLDLDLNLGRPHARGGVSGTMCEGVTARLSSPRPWGCFPASIGVVVSEQVVPTPVGVFPLTVASPLP